MKFRKQVRLLVIDDQVDQFDRIQDFAEMYSSEYRMECKLATTKEEALQLLASWAPSVVLLDVYLAGFQSLDLVVRMTENGAAVIATSDLRVADLVETAEAYGAVGYMPKSDNPDDLEALMDYVADVSAPIQASH